MREMKDSGIEWIGKIPADWHRLFVKHLCHMQSGDNLTSLQITDDGLFPVYGGNGFRGYYHLYNCDGTYVLVGRQGALCGNVHIISGKFWATDHAVVTEAYETTVIQYLFYLLTAMNLNQYSISAAQPGLAVSTIQNLSTVIPPLSEQRKIAAYLDKKCGSIDSLAQTISAQIETLEQYKRSVVFQAVSHGMHEYNMVHTESDIWTEIPSNWKLVDIKYLFEIVKRIAGKEGYDILSVTQKGLKVKDISNNEGQIASDYSGYQFVYPTDYVMNHMDLLTGWVDCSTLFGVTSPDYRVFRLKDKTANDSTFYKYVMQCCYMCKIFYSLGQGVSNLGRWRLQTSAFMNFQVPVPPIQEQRSIAEYLDKKCKSIDNLIQTKQDQLAALDEYKKSLIYEYVTGKKEVPSA